MSEWISVKDRLPEKSGNYIVADVNLVDDVCLNGVYVDVLRYSAKHKLFNTSDNTMKAAARRASLPVTHWMPLPELPEESEVESDA